MSTLFSNQLVLYFFMWERSVTRASVELYDMGEREGGRPECEDQKPHALLWRHLRMLS